MNRFLKTPNIPCGKVTSVLVDYRINPKTEITLKRHGITVYKTCKNHNLYEAVSGHPDMSVFHLGDNRFISAPENADFYSEIPGIEIISGKSSLSEKYPADIAYNAARVGKWLIHNFKHTDEIIMKNSEHLSRTNVSQGYSKCSVCIVTHSAIITSDSGIVKAAAKNGIDALLVNDESIILQGVSHGFLGGSAGLIAPDILAVNGNITTHENYNEITDFCAKYGVRILSLHEGLIEDIGSIIPLTEII